MAASEEDLRPAQALIDAADKAQAEAVLRTQLNFRDPKRHPCEICGEPHRNFHCCDTCNMDRHICHFCGDPLGHAGISACYILESWKYGEENRRED